MKRFAVVDVGTNSVKFHIGEREDDGSWRTLVDRSEITRLGEGRERTGAIEPEPLERTVEAIAGMVEQAKQEGVDEIAAVGTAALRAATNRAAFLDAVRERIGVTVDVISGEEEARLAYLAATASLDLVDGPLVVFDSGGGSSQFTFGRKFHPEEQFSVPLGAVGPTERFALDGPVSRELLAEALAFVSDGLSDLDGRPAPDALVAMGGTVTNLAAVKHGLAAYDADVVNGTVLDREEVERQMELFRMRTADERREIAGLQPKRAEVILGGACITRTVMEKLRRDAVTVSDRGLRHGLLVERFG